MREYESFNDISRLDLKKRENDIMKLMRSSGKNVVNRQRSGNFQTFKQWFRDHKDEWNAYQRKRYAEKNKIKNLSV